MKSAYRVPIGMFPSIDRFISQETAANMPITEIVVNSLITSPTTDAKVQAGALKVTGLAWDGGHGLDRVEISTDGGRTWQPADLGENLGRYAFRPFSATVPAQKGTLTILTRASNAAGQTQVPKALFNPAGYHNNVYNSVSVTVA